MVLNAVLSAAALASAVALKAPSFDVWRKTHGKIYGSAEEMAVRRSIYMDNIAKVNKHNAEAAAGLHTWRMGAGPFSDLTAEEWKSTYASGYLRRPNKHLRNKRTVMPAAVRLPQSVDWVAAGAVTPIKNQGQCGSCWAFSTTGSVEGIVFIDSGANKTLTSLSEQQLVDCSTAQGNEGCNGGLMDYAFQYIITNGGICSENNYPYKGVDESCRHKNCTKVSAISGFQDVPQNNEPSFQTSLVGQPISIAIEADQNCFQQYAGGVLGTSCACGTNLDHGVLAVGWGTDPSAGDYYSVKNSWGTSWGEAGYVRLGRGPAFAPNGQCGLLMEASYPTGGSSPGKAANDQPDQDDSASNSTSTGTGTTSTGTTSTGTTSTGTGSTSTGSTSTGSSSALNRRA
jgi:C1A family cysteine protease